MNKYLKVKIDINIPDFGNHPYFVKKTAEAKAFIERVGLPSDLLKLPNDWMKK